MKREFIYLVCAVLLILPVISHPQSHLFDHNHHAISHLGHGHNLHQDSIHYQHDRHTEYFDLSYNLDEESVFYPFQRFDNFVHLRDTKGFNRTATGNFPYWYASYSFCMSEHGGTHLDAPFHFNKFGWKLNEIPLNRLVDVPAVIIDVEHQVFSLHQPDEFILDVSHILEHEEKYGPISSGSVILVRTGWSRFWGNKQRYLGWDNSTAGSEPTLHFPGLSGDAASWLVRERQIIGLGIDTASPDIGNYQGNPVVHIILCESQVYMIENMANLDNLVKKTRLDGDTHHSCDLRLMILPIKTAGTGGPARIIAYCKHE